MSRLFVALQYLLPHHLLCRVIYAVSHSEVLVRDLEQGLTVVVYTLDETTYSRELAPLAGHYPALRLGPPWWFFDSPEGIRRFYQAVIETAGGV